MKKIRQLLHSLIPCWRFLVLMGSGLYARASAALKFVLARHTEAESSPQVDDDIPKEEACSLYTLPEGVELTESLRDLAECRMEDIRDSECQSIERAGLIVDFLDEIRLILPTASPFDAVGLEVIRRQMKAALEQEGGELLFFDTWTPEYQRAVEVDRCLPKDSLTIINKHKAYGFMLNGKLIRKQEVSIKAPIL